LGDLDEIKQKEAELGEERNKQHLEFMARILEQNLARDGWTENEAVAFEEQMVKWGLWSTDVIGNTEKAIDAVGALEDKLNGIVTERRINFYVSASGLTNMADYDQRVAEATNSTPKPYASGGSFTVPSSYGYEGFNMGNMATASAGETVTVTPQGQQSGNNEDLLAAILALPRKLAQAMAQQ
jgi:hypothetical protein